MRANKRFWVFALLAILFVISSILISSTDFAGSGDAGGDPERYAFYARPGNWSDWHGILLVVELTPLRSFLEWLAHTLKGSTTDHGITALVIWQVLSTVSFCVCVLLWTVRLWKKDPGYVWSLLIFSASFLIIDYYAYWNFKMYVDYNYMAWVIIGYTGLFYINSEKKWARIWAWLFFILAMIHVGFLRHNGAVLLPVFAFFLISELKPAFSLFKRTCWAGFACAAFYIGVSSILGAIPCKHTHVGSVMMREDLRIAALLENRMDEYPDLVTSTGDSPTGMYYALGQNVHTVLLISNHDEMQQHYIEQWKTNTKTMVAARLIEIAYFFTNGQAANVLRPYVEKHFPAVRNNPSAWQFEGYEEYGKAGRHGWERLVIYLIGITILAVLVIRYGRGMLKGGDDNMACKHVFRLLVIALTYMAGFIICTPSLDNRYHCMSIILSFYAFSVLLCHMGISNKSSQS